MQFKFIDKEGISQLPKTSGVYAFKKGGEFLYIGKAANLRERVKNHFQQPTHQDNFFINQVSKVGFLKTSSEIEALILEANLIKKYQPKYNVIWKDSKNYFYVVITKEDFPRVFITHQPQKIRNSKHEIRNKIPISNFPNPKQVWNIGISNLRPLCGYPVSDLGFRISDFKIVGPFVDGKALKQTLKILRKVFPYRSCFKIPNRPCLWYHLNRCLAPCLLKSKVITQIPKDSLKIKKMCQRNAENLIRILKEGKNPVLKGLKREMKLAAKKENFEEAAKIRNQISALEKVMEHAKIFEPLSIVELRRSPQFYDNWLKVERKLKEILKIKRRILRIEAYDVSNIQGQEATGSMVTFVNGLPDKNFYRRFKIKISAKPNDIAMLKEILSRRFRHKEWSYPDLILIDGGIGQLNAAVGMRNKELRIKNKIRIVSLAKKENVLYIENQKQSILLKKLPQEVFNLILHLRDEAHRFARKYHLKLREIDFLGKR